MKTCIYLITMFLLALFTASTIAQEQHIIKPGDRIRVTVDKQFLETNNRSAKPANWDSKSRVIGSIGSIATDELIVNLGATETDIQLSIPYNSIHKFEVSRGRKSNAGKGAVIGTIVGFSSMAIIVLADCGGECEPNTPTVVGVYGAAGAALGAGIGAGIGSAMRSEKWEEIPLEQLNISGNRIHNLSHEVGG